MERTELERRIADYWQVSKTACQYPDNGRWHRSQYVKKWINELHPELIEGMSPKKLWLLIEDVTTQEY